MPAKRMMLKKMVKSCTDGKGGPGSSAGQTSQYGSDASILAPFKNAYYKRAKASAAMAKIAKLTGLGNS